MRTGNFGQGVNTRAGTGASYYGIMELSGNLWERPVTAGNATGRAFTGTNGNGVITAAGDADAGTWPGTSATGAGYRGGSWYTSATYVRVSARDNAAGTFTSRPYTYGGRGVRLAP